jgi:hypothetical protein
MVKQNAGTLSALIKETARELKRLCRFCISPLQHPYSITLILWRTFRSGLPTKCEGYTQTEASPEQDHVNS